MSSNLPSSFKSRSENTGSATQTAVKNKSNLPSSFTPIAKKTQEDSMWKSLSRTAYQIPSGIAQAFTYPLDLMQMVGIGESLDPEEIERLEEISKREGVPFDKEKYLQAVQNAAEYFPTQSNIERSVEAKTGLPLTPKTRLQKGLKFLSTAGKFTPGTISQKLVGGAVASGTKETLQTAGIPEPLAEMVGLGVGPVTGAKTPAFTVGKAVKPSGMPVRQFEKVTKPKEVSGGKLEQIGQKVEADFKKISEDILSKGPGAETRKSLQESAAFKTEVAEKFRKVEQLAESLPEKLHTRDVINALVSRSLKKKGSGFAPGEYDKDFRKFILNYIKDTPPQEIGAVDLVKQYRKNNKELSGAYEPSQSRNYNQAKKDALLEYNRAIAEVIDNKFPDSEFSNLFKQTNNQWKEIADVEAMNNFVESIFDKKIRFEKGRRLFENDRYALPFKRALGDEGFKAFETLMKDLLQSETPYGMLKLAKQRGWGELAETAGAYIVHPTFGKAKLGYEVTKRTYKALINSLLDKPQLTFQWNQAVNDLKKGNFATAEKEFSILDKEVQKAIPKEPVTIEVKAERIRKGTKSIPPPA